MSLEARFVAEQALQTDVSRRTLIRRFAAAAAAANIPFDWAAAASAAEPSPHRPLVMTLAEMVIPTTATSGAGTPAMADFFMLACDRGILRARADLPGRLASELDQLAGAAFLSLAPARRLAVLRQLDADTLGRGASPGSSWPLAKNLILTGYYTAEPGGSQELEYVLVPGNFEPDLPVTPAIRSRSSDWQAVSVREGISHPDKVQNND